MPINGAYSIPGAVMLASALPLFSFNEAVGAYLIAGIFVLFLGVSGMIGKAMRWIPLPIVMAMIAGAMIRFGTGIVTSTQQVPVIAGAALIGYFLGQRLTKKVLIFAGAMGGINVSEPLAELLLKKAPTVSRRVDEVLLPKWLRQRGVTI